VLSYFEATLFII